jgi:hypothetical protein
MMERLKKLLAVREARLLTLRADLTKVLAERSAVDGELATLDRELMQIDAQHRMWEDEWQNWMRDDRVLRHGQDYNLYHVTLSAWSSDVQERRTDVEAQRAEIDVRVQAARTGLLKAQQRVDLLSREYRTAVTRMRARRVGLAEARTLEELSYHDGVAHG